MRGLSLSVEFVPFVAGSGVGGCVYFTCGPTSFLFHDLISYIHNTYKRYVFKN